MPRQRPAPSPHRRGTLIVAGEGVGDDGTGGGGDVRRLRQRGGKLRAGAARRAGLTSR